MAGVPTCTVCGKPVDPTKGLFVDKRRDVTIYTHIECKKASKPG